VLTTTPNALVAPIHDRMPAVLSREEAGAWLAQPGPELLHPAPDDALEATPVSPRVNSVKNDDPAASFPPRPARLAPTNFHCLRVRRRSMIARHNGGPISLGKIG